MPHRSSGESYVEDSSYSLCERASPRARLPCRNAAESIPRGCRELACREDGPFGDDLFYALYKTMQSRITETKYGELRALMPIITYLFVICDLFYRTKEERKRDEEAARAGGVS